MANGFFAAIESSFRKKRERKIYYNSLILVRFFLFSTRLLEIPGASLANTSSSKRVARATKIRCSNSRRGREIERNDNNRTRPPSIYARRAPSSSCRRRRSTTRVTGCSSSILRIRPSTRSCSKLKSARKYSIFRGNVYFCF